VASSPRPEIDVLLTGMVSTPPDALVMLPDNLMLASRERVAAFAMKHRIPTVSGWSVFAQSGGLFTYGPRLSEAYRRLALFADRVLKGAKPADLPVERPSVFELVVNLRTANALGISVPPSVMIRADEVIE
jgi:putative ABC transport system substrate-binding protein